MPCHNLHFFTTNPVDVSRCFQRDNRFIKSTLFSCCSRLQGLPLAERFKSRTMIVSKHVLGLQTAQQARLHACCHLVPTRAGRLARRTISTLRYRTSTNCIAGSDAAAARETQHDSSNSRTIVLAVDESAVRPLYTEALPLQRRVIPKQWPLYSQYKGPFTLGFASVHQLSPAVRCAVAPAVLLWSVEFCEL
jgi:hypothetical protein